MYGTAVPQSEILDHTQSYIYIVDKDDAIQIQAYEDASDVTDLSNPGFTWVNLNSTSSSFQYYKFTTVPGTKYRIYFVNCYSAYRTDVVTYTGLESYEDDNGNSILSYAGISVLDDNFERVILSSSGCSNPNGDEPVMEFVASGTTAYIGVGNSDYGECAFRVRKLGYEGLVEPVVNVSVTIEDPADSFNIQYERNGDYLNITADDNYTYDWYVDGVCSHWSWTYYDLYIGDYEPGTYTITLERNSDGSCASIYVEIE